MNETYHGVIQLDNAYYHVCERHGVFYTVDVFNAGHRRSSPPFRSLEALHDYLITIDAKQ